MGDIMELLDVYNSNGETTGKVVQRDDKNAVFNGDEHIGVSIIYIQNNNGKFLMQKTSPDKGGTYSSTGGHIIHGETPTETIIRETYEEIGLDISNENFIELGHICVDFPVRFIFYLKKDVDLNNLKLQEKEVDSVYYFSVQEIKKMIDEGKIHKGHRVVFEKILEYLEK